VSIFPALRYRDANAAIEWLKEAFGLEEQVVYRDDNGAVAHAQLKLGEAILMLGESSEEGSMGGEPPRPLASTVSLYCLVDDPDTHHDRARAAGAKIVRPLDDMDYGSREYSARDLEGNLWSFGTYDPRTGD
jgi:uncharacterized glyoxalase superfamily protein PhnB